MPSRPRRVGPPGGGGPGATRRVRELLPAVAVVALSAYDERATIVEMIQLGDMHMSYRAERMLWSRHWPALFAGCVILFSLIATARWRRLSNK